MNELNKFAQLYAVVWNEADPGLRRSMIAQLWSEDAVHYTESLEAHGHEAIERRVAGAYEKFVEAGGFVFQASEQAESHHQAVRLRWEMVPAEGGKAAAAGTVFVLLGSDGRIRSDYQFTDNV
ncbi:nuclear transport factor 2 family protein [Paenibacillus sp. P26]|nr:nuclear transport factor 2 family protein [Paenibacillus sp. P26]UUZ92502.1 nuclear transport factor 2 family protein [Paenibacillus sp. P25]